MLLNENFAKTVADVMQLWLADLPNVCTRNTYRHNLYAIIKNDFISIEQRLSDLVLTDFTALVSKIQKTECCSKSTIECRVSALINFLDWLRIYSGDDRFVVSHNRFTRLFSKKTIKVKTKTLAQDEILKFLVKIAAYKPVFGIIACLCYCGAKRISEVLSLKPCDINKERQVTFRQSKRYDDYHTIITIDKHIFALLLDFIRKNKIRNDEYIFRNNSGGRITREHVYKEFKFINNSISPHVLRASAITNWRDKGLPFEDIIKVSGHKSMASLLAYDKSDKTKNPSLTHSLLCNYVS